MKVISLFDGISCARVALDRANVPVETYYASEIDKYSIQVSLKNYPAIIQLGDVKSVIEDHTFGRYLYIDLLIGGSPCQDLSIAKKGRQGLDGKRSGLFYEYVNIRDRIKPKYFILENVASMSKEARDTISEALGVQPIMINASLVSAQIRKRYFWVGKLVGGGRYEQVDIELPEDRNILLKDIIENADTDRLKSFCIDANYHKGSSWAHYKEKGVRQLVIVPEATKKGYAVATEGQSVDLSFPNSKTRRGRVGDKVKNLMTTQNIGVVQNSQIRKLTPVECERLQGLPDNYTEGVSNTQRYKALGNAFNVDVVAHIIKTIFVDNY